MLTLKTDALNSCEHGRDLQVDPPDAGQAGGGRHPQHPAKTYGAIIDILRKLPEQGTIYSIEKEGTAAQPSPKGMELIQQQIVPNLEKLQKDDDVDVRFFAASAAQRVDGQSDADAMNTSP